MTANEILHYWYSAAVKKQWFAATPQLDREIYEKYADLWQQAADGLLDHWMGTAEGCLALCIVLDQLPLNMFRGQAKSFSTEAQAIRVTRQALNQHFEQQLAAERLPFLFMPLMHSEDLADQKLSVALFKEATNRSESLQDNLRFAEHHCTIIEKYHRFPHRNAILGRRNTPEESVYLASKQAFKG